MTRDALLLGVDVGGTTTAAGAVTREGAVLVEQRVLTHRDGKGRAPETIIELLGSVREQAERRGHAVEAIGVGVPGPVDPTVGRIGEHVPHVPELAGRALAAELARGRVAGRPDAPLLTAAGGDPRAITAPLVFRAAREGDAVASAVVDEACRALGAMLGAVVNGLNPELIVLTGGVAESLVPLEAQILQRAAEYAFRAALARTRVTIVPGDKRTSMRGAAALAIYEIARAGGGT